MSIARALISVTDKTGIADFASALAKKNIEILSTGGTAELLKKSNVPVTNVSDYTGFPEICNGRVKTLHPKIYGGILADRSNPAHLEELEKQKIPLIDLVVCNLYAFEEEVEREGVTLQEAVEQIDIGGPALIRAAAKNHSHVTVVTNPHDYEKVLKEISETGDTKLETRKRLALKAFSRTYHYDEMIEHYLRKLLGEHEILDLHYEKLFDLRYGENPHQKASFYRNPLNRDANIANAKVLHGKELSFNNIVDGDSALELVKEFLRPTAAIIKHNNPCGVGSADTIEEAIEKAFRVDPISAFGGVLASNRPISKAMVDFINEKKWFLEIVIAPSFDEDAITLLKKKKDIRLLEAGELKLDVSRMDIKKVAGGILMQTKDTAIVTEKDLKVVSKRQPTKDEIQSMLFAMHIAKFVRSNAVVFAKDEEVTGIGAGQMSRVDSVVIAAHKGEKAGGVERVKGSVMASDAFLPFPDAAEVAAEHGIIGIIQPGGSIRDQEVIDAVDRLGLSMVFTGVRFFRH